MIPVLAKLIRQLHYSTQWHSWLRIPVLKKNRNLEYFLLKVVWFGVAHGAWPRQAAASASWDGGGVDRKGPGREDMRWVGRTCTGSEWQAWRWRAELWRDPQGLAKVRPVRVRGGRACIAKRGGVMRGQVLQGVGRERCGASVFIRRPHLVRLVFLAIGSL